VARQLPLAEAGQIVSSILAVDPGAVSPYLSGTSTSEPPGGAQSAGYQWNMQTDAWEWESALIDVLGSDTGEAIPALLALVHPDDLATTRTMLRSALHGKGFSYPHRIFRKDGYVRPINVKALVDFDSAGSPAVVHGVVDARGDWRPPLSPSEMGDASDGDLMLGLRAQMPEALVEAIRRYSSHMHRVVRPLLNTTLFADDIIQEVFEDLFRRPERFDARRGSLGTYLNMSARSRSIDIGRSEASRRRREVAREHLNVAQGGPEDQALPELSGVAIRMAVASLPPDERKAIEMAFFGGFSYRAVGKQLGVPEGTVKARIKRGLQRLRTSQGIVGAIAI
jgi:RNA polymerase sigma factor (sigma-70 family)